MVHAGNQKITNKERSPRVAELRGELRHKIAAHTLNAGAHAIAILGLTLYRRTEPSPCYPVMYEPSLNVFVQGRKRITLAGTTYLCDESTFLLSSIDVPVVSRQPNRCSKRGRALAVVAAKTRYGSSPGNSQP